MPVWRPCPWAQGNDEEGEGESVFSLKLREQQVKLPVGVSPNFHCQMGREVELGLQETKILGHPHLPSFDE